MWTRRLMVLSAFLLVGPCLVQSQGDEDEVIDLQELLVAVSKGFNSFSKEMRTEFATFAETLRSLKDGMRDMKITLEEVRQTSSQFTTSNEEIKQTVEKTTNLVNTLGQDMKTKVDQTLTTVDRYTQEVKNQFTQSQSSLNRFGRLLDEQTLKTDAYFKSFEEMVRGLAKSSSCCDAVPEKYQAILTRLNDLRDLSVTIQDSGRGIREAVEKSTTSINSLVQSQKEIKETVRSVKEVTNNIQIITTSSQQESSTCSSSLEAFIKENNIWKEKLNEKIDKVVEKQGTCDKDKDDGDKDNGEGDKGDNKNPVLDCLDAYKKYGYRTSQVYNVRPKGSNQAFPVFCDMTDGGGWTVIQRRGDFGNPDDYFFRTWADYKYGFGNMNKEFWLGNEKINALTSQQDYEAKVDLWDINSDNAFARYNSFKLEGERGNYMLRVSGYSGTAGDALKHHTNSPFSTRDKVNMVKNSGCMENDWMSGWWYGGCSADLNGLNLRDRGSPQTRGRGIKWNPWLGSDYSLAATVIKIRPKD